MTPLQARYFSVSTSPQAAWDAHERNRQSLLEDYRLIGGPMLPAGVAARRIGVSKRTIERWRAAGLAGLVWPR
jgi:hypothetical protein